MGRVGSSIFPLLHPARCDRGGDRFYTAPRTMQYRVLIVGVVHECVSGQDTVRAPSPNWRTIRVPDQSLWLNKSLSTRQWMRDCS